MYSLLLLVDSVNGSGYSNLPHILEAKSDRLAIVDHHEARGNRGKSQERHTVREGTHLLAVYRRNPSCKERVEHDEDDVRDRIERKKNQRLL